MSGIVDRLPDTLVRPLGPAPSVVCIRTAEPKYLVFGRDTDAPAYVLQCGPRDALIRVHDITAALSEAMPGRLPEPLALVPGANGTWILVQRGLPGTPWFTLKHRVRTKAQWESIRDDAIDTLHALRQATRNERRWYEPSNLAERARRVRIGCERVTGAPARGGPELEALISRLDRHGTERRLVQHGDFCVNNLLFGTADAALIDFEHFGHVHMPLHDEFLLTGSLLDLHPGESATVARSLWESVVANAREAESLDAGDVHALFTVHLMWWVVESASSTLRAEKCARYRTALERELGALADEEPWRPGRTRI